VVFNFLLRVKISLASSNTLTGERQVRTEASTGAERSAGGPGIDIHNTSAARPSCNFFWRLRTMDDEALLAMSSDLMLKILLFKGDNLAKTGIQSVL
jgi:hypothetical protein